MLSWILVGVVLVLVVIWFIVKNSDNDGIPSPPGVPILGQALVIANSNSFHLHLEKWNREFGSLYKINLAGKKMVDILVLFLLLY